MSKTNKLLVQGDYPLIASPTLAQAYGMAAATFLQKLHYCLQNSETKLIKVKNIFFTAMNNGWRHWAFIVFPQSNV